MNEDEAMLEIIAEVEALNDYVYGWKLDVGKAMMIEDMGFEIEDYAHPKTGKDVYLLRFKDGMRIPDE